MSRISLCRAGRCSYLACVIVTQLCGSVGEAERAVSGGIPLVGIRTGCGTGGGLGHGLGVVRGV